MCHLSTLLTDVPWYLLCIDRESWLKSGNACNDEMIKLLHLSYLTISSAPQQHTESVTPDLPQAAEGVYWADHHVLRVSLVGSGEIVSLPWPRCSSFCPGMAPGYLWGPSSPAAICVSQTAVSEYSYKGQINVCLFGPTWCARQTSPECETAQIIRGVEAAWT